MRADEASAAIRARVFGLVAALLVAIAAPNAAHAQSRSLEYAVKANYLVRFAAFVQWPPAAFATATTPVAICVLGPDPFGEALDRAASGQVINGRSIVVRRLARHDRRSGCHILYLGRSDGVDVVEALANVDGEAVLTVTDSARGAERGVVHFAVADNRVRFYIDERAAGRAGLAISSRLLSLALSVTGRS
jgi:hypothetical protein